MTAYGNGSYVETGQIIHPEYFLTHFYIEEYIRFYYFDSASNYTIGFTVDTVSPKVSVLVE